MSGLFSLIFGRLLAKRRTYWLTVGGIPAYVALAGAAGLCLIDAPRQQRLLGLIRPPAPWPSHAALSLAGGVPSWPGWL